MGRNQNKELSPSASKEEWAFQVEYYGNLLLKLPAFKEFEHVIKSYGKIIMEDLSEIKIKIDMDYIPL